MKNKILEDAKKAGFYVSNEGSIFNFDGFDINRQLTKFAALQIPEGYQLVPIEPTKEMLESVSSTIYEQLIAMGVYNRMLAVSPPINTEGE